MNNINTNLLIIDEETSSVDENNIDIEEDTVDNIDMEEEESTTEDENNIDIEEDTVDNIDMEEEESTTEDEDMDDISDNMIEDESDSDNNTDEEEDEKTTTDSDSDTLFPPIVGLNNSTDKITYNFNIMGNKDMIDIKNFIKYEIDTSDILLYKKSPSFLERITNYLQSICSY